MTPTFQLLLDIRRPDLQWFVFSVYFIIDGIDMDTELDMLMRDSVNQVWDVQPFFDDFSYAVKLCGVVLVETKVGTADFIYNNSRVTCSEIDKVLLLFIMLFEQHLNYIAKPEKAYEPFSKMLFFFNSIQS